MHSTSHQWKTSGIGSLIFLSIALMLTTLLASCGGGLPTVSSSKALTAFSLAGAAGSIDETNKTITVTVPNGTNLSALVATFVTTGMRVNVGTTPQTSGITANNFSTPVTYTVMAADGSAASYTVTVTLSSATTTNSPKALTAFSLNGVQGIINETNKTVAVTEPNGTNVTALIASFTTTGASVSVNSTPQISGTTANNFSSPVTYTVTAADGSTASYTVTVSIAPSAAKALTAFSLAGTAGSINEAGKRIAVTLPSETNITNLAATFTTTGNSVSVGGTTQSSGTSTNNFTNPVIYTVTAADGSTVNYTVTVTVLTFTVTSATYQNNATIPSSAVCTANGGSNISPQLTFINLPTGTTSLAFIMDDQTSPCGTGINACVHWAVFNLPSSKTTINQDENLSVTSNATYGETYDQKYAYSAPCPPVGTGTHTYTLTVYALSSSAPVVPSNPVYTNSKFATTYSSSILGQSSLIGTSTHP